MDNNFEESVRRVFADEGGYTNDSRDPGGPTNWGITINDARMYWKRDATAADVRAMPKSVAKQIYKSKYWDAMRCDELPRGLDYAVMDFGVNSGISRSIKFLERIVGLPQDGKPDDTLIRSAAHLPAKDLIAELCDARLVFLRKLKTWPVFGKGWGPRVARVRADALKMASATPLAAPNTVDQTEANSKSAKAAPPEPGTIGKLIRSKISWASVGTFATSALGVLTDWRVAAVIIVGVLAAFIIYERSKKS